MKKYLLLALIIGITIDVNAQSLYKITLYRAAPGEFTNLIDQLKLKKIEYLQNGGSQVFIVRHSQGDQWDFMVYENINSYKDYYSNAKKISKVFTPDFGDDFYKHIAFRESFYSNGPGSDTLTKVFEENSFFHVELFVALPGKQNTLIEQRKMENVYLDEIGRNPNLIFTVDSGAQWDCFTLGGYRDIKHFAESADIPIEKEEKAAIKAGFKGVNDISPYLRSLISMHHDTLGGKVE